MNNTALETITGLAIIVVFLLAGIFGPLRELFSMGTFYGLLALAIMPGIPIGISIQRLIQN